MLAQTLVAEVLDIGLSGGADFAEIFLEDMTVNKAEFTDGGHARSAAETTDLSAFGQGPKHCLCLHQ